MLFAGNLVVFCFIATCVRLSSSLLASISAECFLTKLIESLE